MSKETKDQILARLRQRYATAGKEHKRKLLDLEASLPFALRALDSDNGGEFINHQCFL